MHFLCTKAVEQIAHYESRFILIADMEVKMDKLYWGAVVIFAIGWYIEQRMYVDGYTRRKRDPYKPIDYLGVFRRICRLPYTESCCPCICMVS